jgi:hypothetical protein
MPTELLDFQHELLNEQTGTGLVFGKIGTPYFTMEHPQLTPGDDRFGDVDLEREDGSAFGEDYAAGKTIVFELGVGTWDAENPHVAGADALEDLEAEWKDPGYRNGATKIAVLRSRAVPGRLRRTYGRPRRYAETTSRTSHRGFSTVVCDFVTSDGRWYDDVEQTASTPLVHPPTGGFTTPIKTPIKTSPNSVARNETVVVGGKVPTWPVVTIYGPVSQPSVTLGDLTIAFTGQLGEGESVTFDPRPWQRTVLRNDGANFSGALSWQTPPMRLCQLPVGAHVFGYAGNDETGTSYATVSWRPAYTRW